MDLYQNFPCQFESMGETPTDAPGPKKSPAVPAEPRLGMTTEEVRAIWESQRTPFKRRPATAAAPRSGRTANLDPCALIVNGACPP
jgi:hypothetical protein